MRYKIIILIFLSCVLQCGRSRLRIEVGGYDFEYRGLTYSIESVTPNFLEGYNLLIHREGSKVLLRGIDREQDGTLDEVAVGKISLEEAAEIYAEGIRAGERRGYIRTRTLTREFSMRSGPNRIIVATYLLALGDIYNRLQVTDDREGRSVAIDKGADGRLDSIEEGTRSLETCQALYEEILEKGMSLKKIEKNEGLYIVVM